MSEQMEALLKALQQTQTPADVEAIICNLEKRCDQLEEKETEPRRREDHDLQ